MENILDGIKDKLNDLIKLDLLESSTTTAEKGFGSVRVCKCTIDGQLLAWIIESIDINKRERAYDEAYDILQKMLSAEPQASFEILYSTLYKKYRDKNLFAEFVMDPLRRSLESIQEARNMRQLRYTILVMVHTNDAMRNMLRFSL